MEMVSANGKRRILLTSLLDRRRFKAESPSGQWFIGREGKEFAGHTLPVVKGLRDLVLVNY